MDLKTYAANLARRAKLAAACGTTPDYIYQVSTGHRQASAKLAQAIHRETRGRIKKSVLRPDIWGTT